jgi:hypothetical protein
VWGRYVRCRSTHSYASMSSELRTAVALSRAQCPVVLEEGRLGKDAARQAAMADFAAILGEYVRSALQQRVKLGPRDPQFIRCEWRQRSGGGGS